MDYRKAVNIDRVEFRVNNNIIECGQTTWQIQNIAATSTGRRVLQVDEPEPIFNEVEPTLDLDIKVLLITSGGIWLSVGMLMNSGFGLLLALCAGGAMIYLQNAKLDQAKLEWSSRQEEVQRAWNTWDDTRRNPPILYSLMLETNAGSKPLFHGFDESEITKARNAIRSAMERRTMTDVSFVIETANFGGAGGINNFDSEIGKQIIERGSN